MNTFTWKSIWRICHTDEMRSILEVVLNSYNNGIYDGKILSAVPGAMQAEGSVKRMCEQHEQKERGRKK